MKDLSRTQEYRDGVSRFYTKAEQAVLEARIAEDPNIGDLIAGHTGAYSVALRGYVYPERKIISDLGFKGAVIFQDGPGLQRIYLVCVLDMQTYKVLAGHKLARRLVRLAIDAIGSVYDVA